MVGILCAVISIIAIGIMAYYEKKKILVFIFGIFAGLYIAAIIYKVVERHNDVIKIDAKYVVGLPTDSLATDSITVIK